MTHPHIWPCAAHKIAPNARGFPVASCFWQGSTERSRPFPTTVRQRAITASSPLIRPRSGPRPPSPVGGRLLRDTPQFHNQSSRFVMLFRLTPSRGRIMQKRGRGRGQDAHGAQDDEGAVEAHDKAVVALGALLQAVGDGLQDHQLAQAVGGNRDVGDFPGNGRAVADGNATSAADRRGSR